MQQQQQQQPTSASVPVGGEFHPPPGPGMVCVPVKTGPKTFDRYKHRQSIGIGITQIIIGILCFIFNSVGLGVYTSWYSGGLAAVGHGYWCGILIVITGIFGIVAGKKKSKCQILTFMVMSIISTAIAIPLLVFGIIGAVTSQGYEYDCQHYTNPYDSYPGYNRRSCINRSTYEATVAMASLLAICGAIEAVLSIWGATLCCRSGVCCCSTSTLILPSAGYFPNNGQMIYISQTQGGSYVYSPHPTFSHAQGPAPPPTYLQPGWPMPVTNSGPGLDQAPPAYLADQAQAVWMIPSSATDQDEKKERLE